MWKRMQANKRSWVFIENLSLPVTNSWLRPRPRSVPLLVASSGAMLIYIWIYIYIYMNGPATVVLIRVASASSPIQDGGPDARNRRRKNPNRSKEERRAPPLPRHTAVPRTGDVRPLSGGAASPGRCPTPRGQWGVDRPPGRDSAQSQCVACVPSVEKEENRCKNVN